MVEIKKNINKVCDDLALLKECCFINSFKSKIDYALLILQAYNKTI